MPEKLLKKENASDELKKYSYQVNNLNKVIRKVLPDVILFEQWGLATYLEQTQIPVALDLHGSLLLENYYRKHRSLVSNIAAKIKTLSKIDYLICPSQRQRHYFLPWLMMSGAPIEKDQIGVIPVSFSPKLPKKKPPEEPTFIFSGGLWPWVDPTPALNIIVDEIKQRELGRIKIFSQKPDLEKILPKDDVLGNNIVDVSGSNNIYQRIEVPGFIPHEQLLKEYAQASVAVDIYQWNKERELAFSTRTIEYLWCGLPVLHAGYSEISEYITKYKAGWCLDPKDTDALGTTLQEIFSNPRKVQTYGKNAQKLIKNHFTWDKTIEPLHNFVVDPPKKAKNKTFFEVVSLEFDRIEEELAVENNKMHETIFNLNKERGELQLSLEIMRRTNNEAVGKWLRRRLPGHIL